MQRFTSWAQIEPTATPAELALKEAVVTGGSCYLGKGELPDTPGDWTNPDPTRHIRADVLRFFLLGGCNDSPATEVGVGLEGALVTGMLSLMDCEIPGNMALRKCRLHQGVDAARCNAAKNIKLTACFMPFFQAAGLKVVGQLDCSNTRFQNPQKTALTLQNSKIGEDLFLASAEFYGAADLNGLTTGGQLDCSGASFRHPNNKALALQNAKIGQDFFFPKNITVHGALDLTGASCAELVDDPDCWPNSQKLILDGFSYNRLFKPADARTRLDWLARGDRWNGEFSPQPYKQLANVLDDMGHETAAKEVRVTLARKLAAEARKNLHIELDGNWGSAWTSIWYDLMRPLLWSFHQILDLFTHYGYRPERSIIVLALFWLLATVPAQRAWDEGSFAPNSSIVLSSPEWARYDNREASPPVANPAQDWSENTIPGRDWESFNSFAYAADVVIPIIDFDQTDAWAPSTERGPWGYHLWWARWVFTTFGWIVTALGAAALTGIIRRE